MIYLVADSFSQPLAPVANFIHFKNSEHILTGLLEQGKKYTIKGYAQINIPNVHCQNNGRSLCIEYTFAEDRASELRDANVDNNHYCIDASSILVCNDGKDNQHV